MAPYTSLAEPSVNSEGEPPAKADDAGRAWRSLVASSVANLGVQYNFTNISIALIFLDAANKWPRDGLWGGQLEAALKSIAFLGSIFGMAIMGYVGDLLGRNRAFALTCLCMVGGVLASALAPVGGADQAYAILAACRFVLGFGIGGCYPLSAAKSAESSGSDDVWTRNRATGVVFFWQTCGDILPYVAGMCLYFVPSAQLQFRATLLLGVLPPLVTLYYTAGVRESDEFRRARARRADARAMSPREQLRAGLAQPGMGKKLLATCLCWFLYDIAYYGNNQFTPQMTAMIFKGSSIFSQSWHDALNMAVGVPATLHAISSMRAIGCKSLQVRGFALLAAVCAAIAASWHPLIHAGAEGKWGLFALYLGFQYAVNWGPNMTTFVLPQCVFSTEIRTTFNGLAAACGKLGAIAGIWLFQGVNDACGVEVLMLVVTAINLLGMVVSMYAIEDSLWEEQQAQMARADAADTALLPSDGGEHPGAIRP